MARGLPVSISARALFVQYFGLTSLVLAAPVLQITSQSPEFFVAHGLQDVDLILFVLTLSALPPLLLTGFAWAAATLSPFGRWMHIGQLFALLFLLACEALSSGVSSWVVP